MFDEKKVRYKSRLKKRIHNELYSKTYKDIKARLRAYKIDYSRGIEEIIGIRLHRLSREQKIEVEMAARENFDEWLEKGIIILHKRVYWTDEKIWTALDTFYSTFGKIMDLKEIGAPDFDKVGLMGLLGHKFNGSPSEALEYYLGEVKKWQMRKAPPNSYAEIDALREIVRHIMEESKKNVTDITRGDFIKRGYKTLLKTYGGVYNVISKLPEYKHIKCYDMKRVGKDCEIDAVEIIKRLMKKTGKSLNELSQKDFVNDRLGHKVFKRYGRNLGKIKEYFHQKVERADGE